MYYLPPEVRIKDNRGKRKNDLTLVTQKSTRVRRSGCVTSHKVFTKVETSYDIKEKKTMQHKMHISHV